MISYSKVCEMLTDEVPMTTDFCPPMAEMRSALENAAGSVKKKKH